MPRLNNDEQFKFLISCIRFSNNGKVDFTEVANECNIVSKGAAAKRYERMMKAHGIHQGRESYASMVRPRESPEPAGPGPKKRKGQADNPLDDSDPPQTGCEDVKQEASHHENAAATVKAEPEAPIAPTSTGFAQPAYSYLGRYNGVPSGTQSYEGVHGDVDFNDFINQAMFGPAAASSGYVAEQGGHGHGAVEMPFRETTNGQPLYDGQLAGTGTMGENAEVLDG